VLGQALLALRRYDEVLAEMRVASELEPGNAGAHQLRGEALLRKGDPHAAVEALERAKKLAGGDPTISLQAIRAQAATLDPDEPIFDAASMEQVLFNDQASLYTLAGLLGAIAFVALCLAGALLSFLEQQQLLWVGFAVMFLIAGLCRSASAFLLCKIADLPPHESVQNPTCFIVFLRTGMSENFRYFLLFSGLMHSAVLVAGPFFVIYVLQDLHLTHWQYGTWPAAGIIGQFLTLSAWGQFGDRCGNKALLTFTGLLVAFLPMLYLLGTAWLFLVTVNFFGGVVWAGLGLGLNNYVFDAVQPTDRGKAVAVSSIVNAIGWAMGTVVGSVLIDTMPGRLQTGTLTLEPVSNLPFIFFLSGLFRLIVSATLLRTFHEPRQAEQRAHHRLLWELPLLNPLRQLSGRAVNRNQ